MSALCVQVLNRDPPRPDGHIERATLSLRAPAECSGAALATGGGATHPKQYLTREPPHPGPPDTSKAVRPPQHHPAPIPATPHDVYYLSHAFPRQTNHQQRKPTRPPTTTTAATEMPAIAPVERALLLAPVDAHLPPSRV